MIFRAFSDGRLELGGRSVRCALGAAGVVPAEAKREGDRATPAGTWPLRRVLYRADRGGQPRTGLAILEIAPDDGWCDAPGDPRYNRPVRLPYAAGAERLWREDGLYDPLVVLGCNDDPPVSGKGSAIFLHIARRDYGPTQGCVAVARPDLEAILALAGPDDALEVG